MCDLLALANVSAADCALVVKALASATWRRQRPPSTAAVSRASVDLAPRESRPVPDEGFSTVASAFAAAAAQHPPLSEFVPPALFERTPASGPVPPGRGGTQARPGPSSGRPAGSDLLSFLGGSDAPAAAELWYDYASTDASARVVASNVRGAKAVQSDADEKYLLVPCATDRPRWMTLALAEDLRVERIILEQHEFFAGSFRHIQVLGAATWPTEQWRLIAQLETSANRTRELFDVRALCGRSGCWARYLKVRLLSTHPSAFPLCAMNRLRVFGSNVLTSLGSELSDPADAHVAEHDAHAPRDPTRPLAAVLENAAKLVAAANKPSEPRMPPPSLAAAAATLQALRTADRSRSSGGGAPPVATPTAEAPPSHASPDASSSPAPPAQAPPSTAAPPPLADSSRACVPPEPSLQQPLGVVTPAATGALSMDEITRRALLRAASSPADVLSGLVLLTPAPSSLLPLPTDADASVHAALPALPGEALSSATGIIPSSAPAPAPSSRGGGDGASGSEVSETDGDAETTAERAPPEQPEGRHALLMLADRVRTLERRVESAPRQQAGADSATLAELRRAMEALVLAGEADHAAVRRAIARLDALEAVRGQDALRDVAEDVSVVRSLIPQSDGFFSGLERLRDAVVSARAGGDWRGVLLALAQVLRGGAVDAQRLGLSLDRALVLALIAYVIALQHRLLTVPVRPPPEACPPTPVVSRDVFADAVSRRPSTANAHARARERLHTMDGRPGAEAIERANHRLRQELDDGPARNNLHELVSPEASPARSTSHYL